MNQLNQDKDTVRGFGDEWMKFDQSKLLATERKRIFDAYFNIFPWEKISNNSIGADIGCGSGRWAMEVAPKVGQLIAIDASQDALNVARKNLNKFTNIKFENCSVDSMGIANSSLDFAYSLGVLHHVPDTKAAIKSISNKLKDGAPFLIYLYYDFDNRSAFYVRIWKMSEYVRSIVSKMPFWLRYAMSQIIAFSVYFPLARIANLLKKFNLCPDEWPLADYSDKSFYVMRTDALDRFGTRLEQRFSRESITSMLDDAGFENIQFSNVQPYWCAVATKKY